MHLDLKSTIRRYYQIWLETNELYSQWAEQHGITINTLLVLYMVRNTERCTQTDLCRMLMLPKQTVNSILKNLESRGYVSQQTDSADRRNKIIIFSPEGRDYAEHVLAELYEAESEAFNAMSPEEVNGLISHSGAYLRHFRKAAHQ